MYRLFFGLSLVVFVFSLGKEMFLSSKTSSIDNQENHFKERFEEKNISKTKKEKSKKLSDAYCISFGSPTAKIKVVEYFSFSCPSCIRVFQNDFQRIKEKYIDLNEIYWVFHPVPIDQATVQALAYLEKMTTKEKRVFLTAILDEAEIDSPDATIKLMEEAAIAYQKPISSEDIVKAKEVAFQFALRNQIVAIPFIEVDGELYEREVPDLNFISKIVKKRKDVYASN